MDKKSDFLIGDLVTYIRYEQCKVPQLWKRLAGIGVILRKSKNNEMQYYTVWSNGESFECIEVYHLTDSELVCDVNEFENIKKQHS